MKCVHIYGHHSAHCEFSRTFVQRGGPSLFFWERRAVVPERGRGGKTFCSSSSSSLLPFPFERAESKLLNFRQRETGGKGKCSRKEDRGEGKREEREGGREIATFSPSAGTKGLQIGQVERGGGGRKKERRLDQGFRVKRKRLKLPYTVLSPAWYNLLPLVRLLSHF